MANIPIEHVRDSQSLIGDGYVELFELTPAGGTGLVRFKADNDVTYRGQVYTGMPLKQSGEKKTSDAGLSMPKLTIGDENSDLSAFKPLVYDGFLDNAIIVKKTILLDNLINNRLIFETDTYRVKRVEEYGRTRISLQLATQSDSLGFNMPFRQYLPPAYPSVQM